ncbi:MAG: LytTR family DNA-binding domain-containing protein [Evtepia sp.]
MKIAIVEDEAADRKQLVTYLNRFSYEKSVPMQISTHCMGENFLEDEDPARLDLVILDIFMGEKSGMEVAEILREREYDGFIVFCTTSPDYALKGYGVQASGYLLKPFEYEKLSQLLLRLTDAVHQIVPHIIIKENRHWCKVPLESILYVENHANYVYIHTMEETYSSRMPFSEMECSLTPYACFVKCDRGIMANLHHVRELKGNVMIMSNLDTVSISRRNLPIVNERYLDTIFEEMEQEDV